MAPPFRRAPRQASKLENYCGFHWRDANFAALDPYSPTTGGQRGDRCRWTFGKHQYDWLPRQCLSLSECGRAAPENSEVHDSG